MEFGDNYDVVFAFHRNLDNSFSTYLKLLELYDVLRANDNKRILLDFTGGTFISANLLAIFGCCFDSTISNYSHRIAIKNLHPKIKVVMQKNGFNKYFAWEDLKDTYHSTMDYAVFEVSTEHMVDFERYLLIHVFSRNELPAMSEVFKDRIVDNFLEIFNNVIDHANSESVYVCGQFFPKSLNLSFSIVDLGRTIKANVTLFLQKQCTEIPLNSLQWAIVPGNSTKAESAPRGLGFSILLEFIKLNKGSFVLISDNEVYEINKSGERFKTMPVSFPGTIVTITINLKDNQLYFLDDNQNDVIVF